MTHPLEQINFQHKSQAYVIEASAGTGKTWTIERLFIKALLEGVQTNADAVPLSIENILVVTFTNDATDELKQRIQDQLYQTIRQIISYQNQVIVEGQEDVFEQYLIKRVQHTNYRNDITLLTRALQNFDTASIFTIHGFCNKVLHDYQLECKINAKFELVANHKLVVEQLVMDFIRRDIINNPDFVGYVDVVFDNMYALFTDHRTSYSQTLANIIARVIPDDLFMITHGDFVLRYAINQTSELELLKYPLRDIAKEISVTYKKNLKADVLACIIKYVAHHYPALLSQTNQISYDELIERVKDSIHNSVALADKLFNKYPIAFIDEFQDTDSSQWQIFSTIYHLQSITRQNTTTALHNRGHLIVVGDPKQAIYSFRGADVDTYIEARDLIKARLELNANFRSHSSIMNFVNQVFSLSNQNVVEANSFLGNGIGYSEVIAKSDPDEKIPSVEEMSKCVPGVKFYSHPVQLVVISGKNKGIREDLLLNNMTLEILALLKADPQLKGKIAILVTKNSEANTVVKHLHRYGVKAVQLKVGNIFATSMAEDLLKILMAISDLSKRKEFNLAITTRLFNLNIACLNSVNDTTNPELERLQQCFFKYKHVWEEQGIIALAYELIADLVADSAGVGKSLANRDLVNLWHIAELLNKQSKKLRNNFELLYWFKQKIISAGTDKVVDIDGVDEELVRLDNDDEQVMVTTQHKAKGLEYTIVFCPYFKSSVKLDGQYDYSYQQPFFSNYRDDDKLRNSKLIVDNGIGGKIVATSNKEIHRLNYVALTRAKSRLYIYLKQNTLTGVKKDKYHHALKPDKLAELFGFVATNVYDTSHKLFNYPNFFTDDPASSIKNPDLFPGVIVYKRDNADHVLLQRLHINSASATDIVLKQFTANLERLYTFDLRQSYSALTKIQSNEDYDLAETYVKNEEDPENLVKYKYKVLNDKQLSGAKFGTLFHSLCEIYPFSDSQLSTLLKKYDVNPEVNDYIPEFKQMLDEAFAFKVIENQSLAQIAKRGKHEMEFNFRINNVTDIGLKISSILAKYFGINHSFTIASKTLTKIEKGFLIGFIDLFFEHNGKYWVLDYKTNKLDNYISPLSYKSLDNAIIESMAEHHYYLQYLLYLVAIKRYLEFRLNIDQDKSTNLIGGAVYYYVRGVYTADPANSALYIDDQCKNAVCDIDSLFRELESDGR